MIRPLPDLQQDLADDRGARQCAQHGRRRRAGADAARRRTPRCGAASRSFSSSPSRSTTRTATNCRTRPWLRPITTYRLAKTTADEASALDLLARALAKKEDWRPALTAYKASLALVEDADVRSAYDELREEHGFRITDYTVESDAAQPRICFELSDPLDASVTDFAPYFTQDPGPVSAVTLQGSKLCLEGLEAWRSATPITARQGLPSARRRGAAPGQCLRDLRARPGAGRALRRQDLCPAAHRPERHPADLGQLPQRQARALPHRRPQPDLRRDRFELPPAALWRAGARPRPLQGPEGLGGHARDAPRPANEDVVTAFPVARGARQDRARPLCADGAGGREAGGGVRRGRDAMVRRLRSRPLDRQGQGRAARRRALDRLGGAARRASRCASSPATTRSSAR